MQQQDPPQVQQVQKTNLEDVEKHKKREKEPYEIIHEAVQSKKMITSLKIHSKSNFSIVPPDLLRLTSLQYLNLTNNALKFDSFAGFSQLQSLTKLDISGNQIDSFVPKGLGGLVHLERLYMARNKLRGIGAEIARFPALKKLDVSHNRIEYVGNELTSLVHLEKLDISENQLEFIPPFHLPSCIRNLEFACNRISHVPDAIAELEGLKKLNLSHNRLTSVPASLAKLNQLEKLDLRHNALSKLPDELYKTRIGRLRHSLPNHIEAMPGLYIGALCAAQNTAGLVAAGITHILTVAGPEVNLPRDHFEARQRKHAMMQGKGEKGTHPLHQDAKFEYCKLQVLDLPEIDLVSHLPFAHEFIDQALALRKANEEKMQSESEDDGGGGGNSGDSGGDGGDGGGEDSNGGDSNDSGLASRGNYVMVNGVKRPVGGVLVHCRVGISRSAMSCITYITRTLGMPLDQAIYRVQLARPVINPNVGFIQQMWQFEQAIANQHPQLRRTAPPPTLRFVSQHHSRKAKFEEHELKAHILTQIVEPEVVREVAGEGTAES